MKIRTSTKFAVGFVVIAVAAIYGYRFVNARLIAKVNLAAVEPGKVNLVGMDPGAGYRIIVANQMAQLVQADVNMESNDAGGEEGPSSAIKKRIPIREMLGAIKGDPKAIGEFVRIMNDIKQDENWPTNPILWTSEDLQKAFDGDKVLLTKLENDINVKIDGTPLSKVRPSAIFNGILVDFPITLHVRSANHETREVVGRMQLPYRPRLMKAVEELIAKKNATAEIIQGTYASEAREEMTHPEKKEDVKASLSGMFAKRRTEELAIPAERVLGSAEVIVNEGQITGADSTEYEAADKKRYDIKVRLTDEGQKRLWKYSTNRVGTHIMLIVDGVAVAAPRIQHELTQDELTISRMEDAVLVREAVDAMNRTTQKSAG